MITRLYLNNAFRHFDRTFHFGKGLTGVVGPNESGKSLIVEMVRYSLFGTKALRGKAEDYKKLHVELDFVVGDQSYTVIRKGAKVELVGVASGTKPVNEAIQRILGYDLLVFDVANACNQGNIEALSDMRPTERKAMVDRTVGLDMLDELIKFCGTEGNALKREAEAMKRSLIEPVEPEKPEDYRPSAEIQEELKQAQELRREYDQLCGLFASAPPDVECDQSPEEVRAQLEQAQLELKEKHQLEGFLVRQPKQPDLPPAIDIMETEEELVAHQKNRQVILESIQNLNRLIKSVEPEAHSAEDLDEFERWMDQADLWKQKQRLLAQGEHCCPSCKHTWPVAADDLKAFEGVEETQPPSMTRAQLKHHRSLIGNNQKLAQYQAQLDELVVPEDRSADLAEVRQHKLRMDAYRTALQAYHLYQSEVPAKEQRLAELGNVEEAVDYLKSLLENAKNAEWWNKNRHLKERQQLLEAVSTTELENNLQNALTFERLEADFRKLRVEYERLSGEIQEVEEKAGEYLQARERITSLKVNLKAHLLPSLNKVASNLLNQMTGGERYQVEVNDEFEILIDGQALNTLSGSGKAVANLAIRIALGQILTNRVFSLFMADEVDAAMDEERAEYTAQALRRLTTMVTQVILVTHKRPETDHTIELKK